MPSLQRRGRRCPERKLPPSGCRLAPIGRSRVLLDPYTGNVLSAVSTRTAPLAFKISRLWIREIHTGDILGWPTRLLACVMSLILPIMTITGSLIWWNRNRKLLPADTDEQG